MPTCYKCGKRENSMKCICDDCIRPITAKMSKTELEGTIRTTQEEIDRLEKLQGSLIEEYAKKCETRKGGNK